MKKIIIGAFALSLISSVAFAGQFEKGDVLIKLPQTDNFKPWVAYCKGTAGNGDNYYGYPSIEYLEILEKVSPATYATAKERVGNGKADEMDTAKLRAYDSNSDGFIDAGEFAKVFEGVELTDKEKQRIDKELKLALRKESENQGGGSSSSGGSGSGGGGAGGGAGGSSGGSGTGDFF